MAGLVPATHTRPMAPKIHGGATAASHRTPVSMGGRDKPGHDDLKYYK
jgi:hypothetical protein